MKLTYLFAVISNRAVGLLALLILSHIINGEQFGTYSLLVINALLAHTVFGSWLAMATTWSLATNRSANSASAMFRIIIIAIITAFFECFLVSLLTFYEIISEIAIEFDQIASVLALIIATLFFDVVVASKNAVGDDIGYLKVNLARNVGGAVMVVTIALLGGSASLILTGQTLGILLALIVLIAKMKIPADLLSKFSQSDFSFYYLIEMLKFGTTGSLALGTIVFVNSLIRNTVLLNNGKTAAGIYSLVSDLFFAPLILFGASYSLSKMRQLYLLDHTNEGKKVHAYRQFFATIGFLTIPYSVGGLILAPSIAALIVPSDMRVLAISIAGPTVIQSAALTMTVTAITLLLTAGRKRKTLFLVGSTLTGFVIAGLVGSEMKGAATIAWAMSVASIFTLAVSLFSIGYKVIPWGSLLRSTTAAGIMGTVVKFTAIGTSPISIGLSLFLGVMTYGAAAIILRPIEWRELMPARGG